MYRLPLASFRVLEFPGTAPAAYASRLMGDAGAEVILVEREVAPRSPHFRQFNRNKLACNLDFATPQGAALLRRLIARCDVVVQSLAERKRGRLGLTYDALRAIRPDIIVAVMRGPDAGDSTLLHIVAGTAGAAAVCAALLHRRDTGQGQEIVVSSRDCALSFRGISTALLPAGLARASIERLRERGFFEPVSSRSAIEEMPSLPWRLNLTPCHVRLPAPEPGEHDAYVLGELIGGQR